jgi:hypothetical protein
MTQFERIKQMNIEKMAELFFGLCHSKNCYDCPLTNSCGFDYGSRFSGWVKWLESEVEE